MIGFYGPINGYRTAADPAWLGERKRQTERDRESERQTNRQTQRDRDRQTETETERDREMTGFEGPVNSVVMPGRVWAGGEGDNVVLLFAWLYGCLLSGK